MRARRVVVLLALAAIGLPFGPSDPAAASTTIQVPQSIDTSGSVDVTRELEQFFAQVPDGATVVFPSRATYRVDGVLRLNDLRNVTIEGRGSMLLAPTDGHDGSPPGPRFRPHWPRLREHVAIHGADALVVRDLAVRGPNVEGRYVAALEGQAGFGVAASSRVSLQRISVSNSYGDGVYVAGRSSDISIVEGTFANIGRQGVAIVNASNVLVERSQFHDIARSVVDVEPTVPLWTVTGVHVEANEIGDYGNFALAAGGAGAGVGDVWFEGNHVTGGNGIAVFARAPRAPRHGLHIISNTSDVEGKPVKGTGEVGVIQVVRIDGVQIIGNRQRIAAGSVGVTLDGVCNLEMRDNVFAGGMRDREEIAPCGAPASRAGRKPSNPGVASPRRRRSTDDTWLIVGAVSAAVALVALSGLLWRSRRRSTT